MMLIKSVDIIKCSLFSLLISWGTATVMGQNAVATHSIVEDDQMNIVCKSLTQSTEKASRTVKILDKEGLNSAQIIFPCDMFRSLDSFSGEIYNAAGQRVRKLKKSDLQKTAYSSALATDDYYYFYTCDFASFPFTIKFEWEVKCSNGLIGFFPFVPQMAYNQEVKKANYRLELSPEQSCRYQILNADKNKFAISESKSESGGRVIQAFVNGLLPVEPEPYGPDGSEMFPKIYFAPSNFAYDKTVGSMATWKEYGDWLYKLLQGRDQLPEPLKQKLHEMAANCKTDKEKVKVVYDFLRETTRYVSIQLGIGGLQPIPASEVNRTGFGDCKGLSNYTAAMLKELGIPSVYTVISTENERLLPNFASGNQMNHAILSVPLKNDTLWLECTNPQIPLGYVHDDIAGHDALLITPQGGVIKTLPTYADKENTQHITATVQVLPTGEAKGNAKEVARLFQYEGVWGITFLEPSKQKDRVREEINLTQADIEHLVIDQDKKSCPEITLSYDVTSEQYGQKTGNRLFLPINIFRKGFSIPSLTKRTYPIHINYGYADTDSVLIKLPEGYSIEGLPKAAQIVSKFGTFSSSVTVKDKEIGIRHELLMKKGVYAPEEYAAFLDFRKQVANQYNGKVVIKKN